MRRSSKRMPMPEITLTPLIDTALTLLVIFMVCAPMVQNGIKIDLPQGKSKEATEEQEIIISLDKKGVTYFNGNEIEEQMLYSTVQKAIDGKEDMPVFVRADEALSYGKVVELVDKLKQSGVSVVALSTKSK